jgi:hypothetical protein
VAQVFDEGNAFQVMLHFGRWNAHHTQPQRLHVSVACAVVLESLCAAMGRNAVNLDHELSLTAVKVRDVRSNRVLTAELNS